MLELHGIRVIRFIDPYLHILLARLLHPSIMASRDSMGSRNSIIGSRGSMGSRNCRGSRGSKYIRGYWVLRDERD